MIAIKYLETTGRKAEKCSSKVNKGYDLECDGNKISVKLITAENRKGKTTQLKQPWTELILITLNKTYEVDRLGHIRPRIAFKKALAHRHGYQPQDQYVRYRSACRWI